MKKKIMAPTHPGEILMKEFLEPMGITLMGNGQSLLIRLFDSLDILVLLRNSG
jgi:plasmid maintenance system antidote protein VapI